jgi:phage-related protein
MKPVRFLGDSLRAIQSFPAVVQQSAGYDLECVQRGDSARDSKPMPSIGRGVEEIRVWDASGTYRVIYTARMENAVYVLHAFQKKTQQTSKRDIDLARERFAQIARIKS